MKSRKFTDFVDAEGLVLEDTVVKINRCATVVKGGRNFSFSARASASSASRSSGRRSRTRWSGSSGRAACS